MVRKTSGFYGEIVCSLDQAPGKDLKKKKFLFIILEGMPVPFAIEKMELNEDEMFLKLADVTNEEQAKKLVRKEIYSEISTSKTSDEISGWEGILHFKAIDRNFGELGEIIEVLEYPMQMIARCEVNGIEVLFPLNEEIVTDIDVVNKLIRVDLPDGLLDVYLG